MKLSNTTLRELSAKYRSVLRKCAFLNALCIIGVAFAANAEVPAPVEGVVDGVTVENHTGSRIYDTAAGALDQDLTIKNSTFNNNSASSGSVAWATSNHSLTVENSEFTGNTTTAAAGAIGSGTAGLFLKVTDSTFDSNHTIYDGGAVAGYSALEISGSVFKNNTADYGLDGNNEYTVPSVDDTAIGGGAIALGALSNTSIGKISQTEFTGNKSGINGGAIGTRLAKDADNSAAKLDIEATFTENKALANGGAIYNTFYADNGLEKGWGVTVKGTFTSNEAKNGGAIYNDGTKDKASNNGGVMTVNDSTFKGNKVSVGDYSSATYKKEGVGGAIASSGFLTVNSSKFIENTALSTGDGYGLGGALSTVTVDGLESLLYVKDSEFFGNKANVGGAIYGMLKTRGLSYVHIKDSSFIANEAVETGSAIANFDEMDIINSEFIGNKISSSSSDVDGGTLFLGSESSTSILGGSFKDNSSTTFGGAIATRSPTVGNQENAKLRIEGTSFAGNTAQNGGAIYNSFYQSASPIYTGGAVYNSEPTYSGVVIKDATFIGNEASQNGGAIYNDGTLDRAGKSAVMTLAGTNVFIGNKANGVLNDIYNDGELHISGEVTFDGGIAGNGDIRIEDGTTLNMLLGRSLINADLVYFNGAATFNLLLENDQVDEVVDLIVAQNVGFEEYGKIAIADNPLYNFKWTDYGTQVRVSVKSGEELIENLPSDTTSQEANTVSAIANTAGNGNETANTIAEGVSLAVQAGNGTAAVKAAKDLAPTTSQTIVGVTQNVNNILANVAGNRMATVGRAGGDAFVGGALWAQGLYNHSKQDSSSKTDGFSANTRGVSFGLDGKITEQWMIGLGYGYTDTDADSGDHDIDVTGHNFFIYTEYKPSNWYINGMFTYGLSKYDEKKFPMGIALKAEYDVNSYAANIMTGYDFANGLTPEVGLRYLLADQESYNDGAQHISSENTDVLTGVVGVKYHQDYKASTWTFKPNLRLAATYDMISDNSKANVNISGGSAYQITGERLERFGVEAGVGIEASIKDWNFSVDYNGAFRHDYQSHTGMLKAKYNF